MKKRGFLEILVIFVSLLLASIPFYVADVFAEEDNIKVKYVNSELLDIGKFGRITPLSLNPYPSNTVNNENNLLKNLPSAFLVVTGSIILLSISIKAVFLLGMLAMLPVITKAVGTEEYIDGIKRYISNKTGLVDSQLLYSYVCRLEGYECIAVISFDLTGYDIDSAGWKDLVIISQNVTMTNSSNLNTKVYTINQSWTTLTWNNVFPNIDREVGNLGLTATDNNTAYSLSVSSSDLVGNKLLLAIRDIDTVDNVKKVTGAKLKLKAYDDDDDDDDGVPDVSDTICPDTPRGEGANQEGCSCTEIDPLTINCPEEDGCEIGGENWLTYPDTIPAVCVDGVYDFSDTSNCIPTPTYNATCDLDDDDDGDPDTTDCEDNDDTIHHGATEVCDKVDNDCDSSTADGSDETGEPNSNQIGVCQGSKKQCIGGGWFESYDESNIPGYEASETSCSDGLDNDCNDEMDYDTLNRGGGVPPHGDNNCPVMITGILVSNNTVCPKESVTVYCAANAGDVNSINAYIDSMLCSFESWSGNNAGFTCNVSNSTGLQTVKCAVDTLKSYQSGTNKTLDITIGGLVCCHLYDDNSSCLLDSACQWCPECNGTKYRGEDGDVCVRTGECNYSCWWNETEPKCGAQCDISGGWTDYVCDNYCSGGVLFNRSNVNNTCHDGDEIDDCTVTNDTCENGTAVDCGVTNCSEHYSNTMGNCSNLCDDPTGNESDGIHAGCGTCTPEPYLECNCSSGFVDTNNNMSLDGCECPITNNGTEICDDIDNDCNGIIDDGCDDDNDTYCDSAMNITGIPAICPLGGGDCNDTNEIINPGAVEICDDIDDNCNEIVDDGCDDDNDTFCDANMSIIGIPAICPLIGEDCDDDNDAINPGAVEVCNDVDDDCDPLTLDGSGDITPDNNNQDGVCQGSKQQCSAGNWTDWYDASNISGYEANELSCSDDLDNDCDSESDYDNSNGEHGDNDCPVNITKIFVSENTACPGEFIDVNCDSNAAGVNSILAYVDSTLCTQRGWEGYTTKFTCNVGDYTGSPKIVKCTVNTSISYQSGSNQTEEITVGGLLCCQGYAENSSCNSDPVCQWCPECNGTKYRGEDGDVCVGKGECNYLCLWNEINPKCGAQCDMSGGWTDYVCDNYCAAGVLYERLDVNNTCQEDCTPTNDGCEDGTAVSCGITNCSEYYDNTIGSCSNPCDESGTPNDGTDASCGTCTPVPNSECDCLSGFVDKNEDMTSDGCECEITNNGIERCDGVDNDCNDTTEDGSGEPAPDNANQVGVCYGSKQQCTGSWTDWYEPLGGYESSETSCSDSLDNDCDAESDYDSSNGEHGDNSCPVGVTGISVSNPTTCPGESVIIYCTTNVGDVDSVNAYIDSVLCTDFEGWNGNTASFTCNAGDYSDSPKTAKCSVDTLKSYQSGTDKTLSITVGGVSCCSEYGSDTGACNLDSACGWCPECEDKKYSGGSNRCVEKGDCVYSCSLGECDAECDNVNNVGWEFYFCDNYCGIDGFLYMRDDISNECFLNNCTSTNEICEEPGQKDSNPGIVSCSYDHTIGNCTNECVGDGNPTNDMDATYEDCTPLPYTDCECEQGFVDLNEDMALDGCECPIIGLDNNCDNVDDDCDGTPDDDYANVACGSGDCIGIMECDSATKTEACSMRNQDCGTCCLCEDDNTPEETYDSAQDSDCTGYDCDPLDTTCIEYNDVQYCKGINDCADADEDCNDFSYESTSTICDSSYKCSGSGDNKYDASGYTIPSRGYCDGAGDCDYSSGSVCSLAEGTTGTEASGTSICVDEYSYCRITCSDGIDNDGDTCTDGADSNCGGLDNDCDNVDDDCDGTPDDDYVSKSCGSGACAGGTTSCSGGIETCSKQNTDCGLCCVCENNINSAPTYVGQDGDCTATTCPLDGCGVGGCGAHIYGDYPPSVSNSCTGIGTCTSNTCTVTCEADNDGDGYSVSCGDCNDESVTGEGGSIHPGAPEDCDGIDSDCDGVSDSNEGLTNPCGPGTETGICTDGYETCTDDGNWINCNAVFPATEECDTLDHNCDGYKHKNDQGIALTNTGSCGTGVCLGSRTRTCTSAGYWGVWGDCSSKNQIDTEDCGAGACKGSRTRLCLSDGSFGDWGSCSSGGNDAGTCAICDASGTAIYDDTQDADCGTKDCDTLDNCYAHGTGCEERNYADKSKVCTGLGTCSDPACDSYTQSNRNTDGCSGVWSFTTICMDDGNLHKTQGCSDWSCSDGACVNTPYTITDDVHMTTCPKGCYTIPRPPCKALQCAFCNPCVAAGGACDDNDDCCSDSCGNCNWLGGACTCT